MSVIFLLIPLLIGLLAWRKPLYNWDLVAYTGCVLSREGLNPEQAHALTFRLLQEEIPAPKYQYLTEPHAPPDNDYAVVVLRSTKSFQQQLRFFQTMWLYVWILEILHRLGMSVVRAAALVSVASYWGLMLPIYGWSRRQMPGRAGLLAAWTLAVCPPILQMARLATPDALSALALTAAGYLLLTRKAEGWFVALNAMAIWIRPDNVILAGLSMAALWLAQPERRRFWLTGMGIAAASYGLLTAAAPGYSWTVLFYHSFIAHLDYPASAAAHLSWRLYLGAIARGVVALGESSFASEFLLLGAMGLTMQRARSRGRRNAPDEAIIPLAWAMAAALGTHFMLYPMVQDRFYIAEYLLLAFAGLRAIAHDQGGGRAGEISATAGRSREQAAA